MSSGKEEQREHSSRSLRPNLYKNKWQHEFAKFQNHYLLQSLMIGPVQDPKPDHFREQFPHYCGPIWPPSLPKKTLSKSDKILLHSQRQISQARRTGRYHRTEKIPNSRCFGPEPGAESTGSWKFKENDVENGFDYHDGAPRGQGVLWAWAVGADLGEYFQTRQNGDASFLESGFLLYLEEKIDLYKCDAERISEETKEFLRCMVLEIFG